MQQFRKFVKGPVGVVMLVLFAVPFIIAGFAGSFSNSPEKSSIAKVGGTRISAQELGSQVQQMRQQLLQRSPQIDPAMIDRFIQPSMVLNGLINNELMLYEAKDTDMLVSSEQAGRILVAAAPFQVDGVYSSQAFQQFVRARGMTESGFVSSVRGDMLMNQVRTGIADTDFSLPFELAEQRRLAEQERDIRYVQKRIDALAGSYDVSDADVEAYYQDNADNFMRAQQFQISYIELDSQLVSDAVQVTEDDILDEYEARLDAIKVVAGKSERRQVSHIQLQLSDARSDQEAQRLISTIQAELDGGASFGDVAGQYSEDRSTAQNGGALGTFTRDELPEAMSQVLFSMSIGQVSEAIEVDGNIHVLKLENVVQRELPTLADLSERIKNDLSDAQVSALLAEKAAQLDELAFEHADLQTPAEQLGVEIQTSAWFALDNPTGIAQNPEVAKALNSAGVKQDGHNSELLELAVNHYAVIRLASTRPPEPIAIEQVRDSIVASVKSARAAAELDELAEQLRAELAAGSDFDALAAKLGGEVNDEAGVRRNAREPTVQIVREAFSLAKSQEGHEEEAPPASVIRLANGDLAIIELTAVREGASSTLTSEQESAALAELARAEGERSLRQSLKWLRDNVEVTINQDKVAALVMPTVRQK